MARNYLAVSRVRSFILSGSAAEKIFSLDAEALPMERSQGMASGNTGFQVGKSNPISTNLKRVADSRNVHIRRFFA
jgi:hypothetical protein